LCIGRREGKNAEGGYGGMEAGVEDEYGRRRKAGGIEEGAADRLVPEWVGGGQK
jgi:hypothetical protein